MKYETKLFFIHQFRYQAAKVIQLHKLLACVNSSIEADGVFENAKTSTIYSIIWDLWIILYLVESVFSQKLRIYRDSHEKWVIILKKNVEIKRALSC